MGCLFVGGVGQRNGVFYSTAPGGRCNFRAPAHRAERPLELATARLLRTLRHPDATGHSHRRWAPFAAWLACFAIAQSFAQAPEVTPAGTQTRPTPSPQKLAPIDVSGKNAKDSRAESTVTRIVVDHDEIVSFGDTLLSDVLKRLPGISVSGTAGNVEIRMRGLGAGYTQILLDGEPVPAGFSLDSLAPDLVERIEILRAPTAEFSTRAIAGTINIVLRKSARKAQRSLKTTMEEQAGRPSFTVDGQVSDALGALSYALGTNVRDSRQAFTSTSTQLTIDATGAPQSLWVTHADQHPHESSVTVTPRATWKRGDADELSSDMFLRHGRTRDVYSERIETPFGAPPAFARDALAFDIDTTTVRGRVNWKHRFAGGASIDAKAGANYFHRHSDAAFDAFDARDVFVLDRTVRSAATEKGFVTSGKYLTPFVTGHAIGVGWDEEYSARTEYRLQSDVSPVGLPPFNIDENYDARVWRVAFFAQDEWDITPRWSAYVGLRWEGLRTGTSGNVIREVSNRSGVWSPIVQTLWKIPGTHKDQLRLALSRTYKAPSTFELTPRRYIANNNTVTTPDFQGNPDLEPELAWGIDTAYEHHMAEEGVISASAYARRIDDVILTQLYNRNGTWFMTPANSGRAEVHGVEFDMKSSLRTWWRGAPNVKVRGNVSRHWSRVDAVPGPDNRLARQTPLSANAGFDYVMDGVPITFGMNYAYARGGNVRLSVERTSYQPPGCTLDAYALWKVDPRTQVRLSASNLLAPYITSGLTYVDALGSTQFATTAPSHTSVRLALELSL